MRKLAHYVAVVKDVVSRVEREREKITSQSDELYFQLCNLRIFLYNMYHRRLFLFSIFFSLNRFDWGKTETRWGRKTSE